MKDKHQKILAKIDQDFLQSKDNQSACYTDRRFCFVEGAMWEGKVGQQFENRPKFEVNKIQLSVVRIYNEWAKNRFGVEFRPDDLKADQDTAETLNALLRGDERDSNADEAYSNAFMEGVSGGIGAVQLVAEYENPYDDSSEQRIRIKPIFEADRCVYWDMNAKRYDKADANHVTLVVSMGRDEYIEKYGDDIDDFGNLDSCEFDWLSGDKVKVAEFYEVSEKARKITKLVHEFAGEQVLYQDDDNYQAELDNFLARGFEFSLQKTVKKRIIKGYVLSGSKIIQELGELAGEYLPIVPFYGKRSYIGGQEVASGHTRLARDVQLLYNVKISSLADLSSRPQDRVPIFTAEQINGHAQYWASQEVDRKPFLTINPLKNLDGSIMAIGPTSYTEPPQVPQALAVLIEKTDQDVHELTGNQASGEQLVSNVSTESVELVQDKVDSQSYIYISNWAKTMAQVGRVWLSMAQVIYDEQERQMTGLLSNDSDKSLIINRPIIKDGQFAYENDVQNGRYRVSVDIGEVFATQRDKAVKRLIALLQVIADPMTQSALINTILANQDGTGLKDLAKFARKQLVMSGIAEPSDDEKAEIEAMTQQNKEPSPQDLWLQAESQKAMAEAERKTADTMRVLADTDNVRADTAIKLSELQQMQAQGLQFDEVMAILAQMGQAQSQDRQNIKQEVGGQSEQPPLPPAILEQIGQQAPNPMGVM